MKERSRGQCSECGDVG